MIISLFESNSGNNLPINNYYDIAIVGDVVDDRGTASLSFLKEKSHSLIHLIYDEDNFECKVDGKCVSADNFESYFNKIIKKSVAVDATTLGFVEIFLSLRALKGFCNCIDILYVEPNYYSKSRRSEILGKREFDLSDEFPGFKAIPGATVMMSDIRPQTTVFFLGYEGRRLARCLEDNPMILPKKCAVIFGVPAYQAGWEMNSFANNIKTIVEKNLRGGIYYCGAGNPLSAYLKIDEIHKSLDKERKEILIIAPIGTKPNGVGAALFAAINENIGLLYDHPRRKQDRSKDVGKWHLYKIDFNSL